MIFGALRSRCRDYAQFIDRHLDLRLDAFVVLPPRPPIVVNDYYNLSGLPVRFDPRVTVKEWLEDQPGETRPVMVKEYHTPGGILRTEVRQTDDWRWGDHVPLFDDYLVPRTKKFLVTGPEDLDALREALGPYNVALILHGHEHRYERYTWEGYDVIMAPSPQIDREGDQEKSQPKGFLVVRISGDRMEIAHHGPLGWEETWVKDVGGYSTPG